MKSSTFELGLRNISQYSGTRVEAYLFDQFVLFGE